MFSSTKISQSILDAVKQVVEPKSTQVVVEEKQEPVAEVAPPGFEGTVKAMKKEKGIDNPFALAWSMKNKGYKSHKKADGTPKNEEVDSVDEALKGDQHKIDKNKNGKIDGHDFKLLRSKMKSEGWDDMLKSVADKKKPQPNGGSGIKKGKSYGNQPAKESGESSEKK